MFSGLVACALASDDDGVVEEPVEEGRRDDGSPKMSPHSAKLLFEAGIIAPFSYLALAIWKNRLAPPWEMGKYPISSTTRIAARVKKRIFFGELALSFGFGEAVGGFGERRLVDALSGFDGGDAKRGREVGLSCAGRSEEVDGFASPDEVELGQSGDSLPVERELECEVEAFDRFLTGRSFAVRNAMSIRLVSRRAQSSLRSASMASTAVISPCSRHRSVGPNASSARGIFSPTRAALMRSMSSVIGLLPAVRGGVRQRRRRPGTVSAPLQAWANRCAAERHAGQNFSKNGSGKKVLDL